MTVSWDRLGSNRLYITFLLKAETPPTYHLETYWQLKIGAKGPVLVIGCIQSMSKSTWSVWDGNSFLVTNNRFVTVGLETHWVIIIFGCILYMVDRIHSAWLRLNNKSKTKSYRLDLSFDFCLMATLGQGQQVPSDLWGGVCLQAPTPLPPARSPRVDKTSLRAKLLVEKTSLKCDVLWFSHQTRPNLATELQQIKRCIF